MTLTILRVVLFSMLAAATACGGDHMTSSGADAFAMLANDLSSAVQRHRLSMGGATALSCPGEMARYDGEVRPLLDRMQSMSGEMDRCMSEVGLGDSADLQDTCAQMVTEYERHLAAGCTAADVAAEATRHAGKMQAMAAHEVERAESMGEMTTRRGSMMGRCGP